MDLFRQRINQVRKISEETKNDPKTRANKMMISKPAHFLLDYKEKLLAMNLELGSIIYMPRVSASYYPRKEAKAKLD